MFSIPPPPPIEDGFGVARRAYCLITSAISACWQKNGVALVAALFLCLAAAVLPAQARTVLDLDARNQPVSLSDWGDYVIQAESAMTAEQVATDPALKWAPDRKSVV